MRKLGVFLFINLFVLTVLPVSAAHYVNIPQTTLQIAKESVTNFYTDSVHSPIVRVGIGTQNFTTYEWNNASIYATGEFELYNNKNYISECLSGNHDDLLCEYYANKKGEGEFYNALNAFNVLNGFLFS